MGALTVMRIFPVATSRTSVTLYMKDTRVRMRFDRSSRMLAGEADPMKTRLRFVPPELATKSVSRTCSRRCAFVASGGRKILHRRSLGPIV